jgi:HSP20 family protein
MTYRIALHTHGLATTAPSSPLHGLERELTRAFGARVGPSASSTATWSPATDVVEDATGWTVHLDLPGVAPEAVEVIAEERLLRVRGGRAARSVPEGAVLRQQERAAGTFERQFGLPASADTGALSAELVHGVLTVRVGKLQPAQARRVPVTAPVTHTTD